MAPWADVLYGCDQPFWRAYFPEISRRFPGELWTASEAARDEFGLHWVHGHSRAGGLSLEPHTIHCGKNSGYQAIGLAFLFGCRRLILLGYDMRLGANGERHWHGDHTKESRLGNPNPLRFPVWRQEMTQLAKDLRAQGCEVVNASRRTALRCFPRVELEEALK